MRSFIYAAVFAASVPFTVSGQEQAPPVKLILEDNPAGSVSLPPLSEEQLLPRQEWLFRTGDKKGIQALVLDEEAAAASDVAVLKAGFYEQALEFLADMREPSLLAGPDGLAGLAGTKPVLLIPSGGLSGTASSEFFKAGLAEFVRAGGTVVCLSQRTGADYDSLPVPEGPRQASTGWAEERGPLFGVSAVREPHPSLARVTHSVPHVETSGYLSPPPAGAQVLLARSDDRPTLMVYPYGAGRVVVTALFTDVLSSLGHADAEERALMQDLLLWAKAPLKTQPVSPGNTLNLSFTLHGSAQDAPKVRIQLFGSGSEAPASDRIVDIAVKAGQTVSLPFPFTVPASLEPGIYHFEYQLLDQKKRPLSSRVECADGRMSVGKPKAAGADSTAPKTVQVPAAPPKVRIHAGPLLRENGLRINLEIVSLDTAPASSDELVLRAGDGERTFRLEKGRAALTIDLGDRKKTASLPVSVYHASGMLLTRENVQLETGGTPGVSLDRSSYLAGETARVRARGLGSGELTLTGLGRIENDIIRESGNVEFPVPDGFPAGSYPLSWEVRYPGGKAARGETTITIEGNRVRIADASVKPSPDGKTFKAETVVAIEASRPRDAVLRLMFTGPDGIAVLAAERTVALLPGSQTVSLPVTLTSEQAGIAVLAASVSAVLPQGPGLPAVPVTFAEHRVLIDRGNTAVIGLALDRPFFVEPSGTMTVSAYLSGTGKAALRLSLGGKKVFKERFELSGSKAVVVNLAEVKPGAQVLRAELDGSDIPSVREMNVVNGTILPDLVPSVVVGDITGTELEIGIGVKNEGKTASGPSRAVLSDGDPDRDGRIIQKIDVPPLAPGQPFVSITKWSVLKRTGLRTLFAVADARNAVAESNKKNNREQYPYIIPDIMVKVKAEKKEIDPGEPIIYTLSTVNLSSLDRKQLMFSTRVTGPGPATISSEEIPVDELPSTKARTYPRTFTPSAPLAPGKYLILAELTSGKAILANSLAEVRVPPVLDLAGSFEGTPESAVLCRPFTVHFRARNTGNIPVSSGTMTIEVWAPGVDLPALVRELPFALKEQRSAIDRLDLPAGSYRIILKVSASNKEHNITRELIIAEQPLNVTGPLKIESTGTVFPRVLLLAGNTGGLPARAALENMLRLAFQQEGIFYKLAGSPEEFSEQAMSGMFSVFVLLDVSEQLQDPRWLKDLAEQGQGVIISGADETARAIGGVFGFSFGEPISSSGAALVISERSVLGFSGTIPVSGTVLPAKKSGTVPLALTADSRKPAILLDRTGNGKTMLIPFALINSSRESGTGDIYALLLRNAAIAVTPERDEPGGFTAGGISLSSPSGPIKARISVTLPGQSHFVWTNRQGIVREGTSTFELSAGEEPQKVLYLHTPAPGAAKPVTEVFYECDGKYVSQGRIE